MMKKCMIPFAVLTAGALLAACGGNDGETANNNEETGNGEAGTVTLGVTPWTSTIPPTEIVKIIIEDMGYEVEETSADVSSVFMGLSRGDIDVFMDSWLPVHDNYFSEYEDDIIKLATSYEDADSGLAVPDYILDEVSSIPELQGNEDVFDNALYGIEEGASATEQLRDLIDEYDLDLELVNSSEGGMIAQAQRDMSSENPVVFYGWRPHAMFNQFDIELLEDPDGFFEESSVHVVVNHEFEDRASDVYAFLENWSISIDDVEEMILQIEEGEDEADVAQQWIDDNQDAVDEMLNN